MAATKPPSNRENASLKLKGEDAWNRWLFSSLVAAFSIIASIFPHARSSLWRINKGARGTFDLLQFIISD
jgi:hypothetical protein